jgi:site-specific DNA recombinase
LIEDIEASVEEHYSSVQPKKELLNDLENLIIEELEVKSRLSDAEKEVQQRRIRNLRDERKKLLDAHYADAVPLDLLKSEQSRIGSELQGAEERLRIIDIGFNRVKTNLSKALSFASDWKGAYLGAGPTVRRQLNQAIFKKLLIDNSGRVRSEYAEPFGILLSDEVKLTSQIRGLQRSGATEDEIDHFCKELNETWKSGQNKGESSENSSVLSDFYFNQFRQGLKDETLVGRRGLEPLTPCASCKCASQLRQRPSPLIGFQTFKGYIAGSFK